MDLILESSAVTACLFEVGTLNLYIGVSHSPIALSILNPSTMSVHTYLHLKVKNLIESFIVKLEQSTGNYETCSKVHTVHIRIYTYTNTLLHIQV